MAYELKMGNDGILRMRASGNVDVAEMESFRLEFEGFLATATEEQPLKILTDSSKQAKYSAAARKIFVELQRSPKVGRAAVVGAKRYTRVLTSFILRASGRDNVRFFDSEAEAVAWLKEGT